MLSAGCWAWEECVSGGCRVCLGWASCVCTSCVWVREKKVNNCVCKGFAPGLCHLSTKCSLAAGEVGVWAWETEVEEGCWLCVQGVGVRAVCQLCAGSVLVLGGGWAQQGVGVGA